MIQKLLYLYLLAGNPEGPVLVSDYYEIASQHLKQEREWASPPHILVCNSSRVTKSRLNTALNFWKNLGYTFGDVYYADKNDYNCATGEPLFGQIMIDIPSSNFRFNDHLGNTKTWFSEEDKRILKVKIEILEGWSDSSRILEHEIGHALGWNDVNITGHIMNGIWSRSGNNVKGLQK
jgi:hypothetical protein